MVHGGNPIGLGIYNTKDEPGGLGQGIARVLSNTKKIPNFAIDNIQQSAFQQCFGIRNDAQWQTWLLYPDANSGQNQILVYNYEDRSWSIYRPSLVTGVNLTCFGLYDYPFDVFWNSFGTTLPDWSWEDFGDETWQSFEQSNSVNLLSGDAQGNVWVMNQGGGDAAGNTIFGQSLDPGKEIELNLITRQWFPFASEGIAAQFGYVDFLIDGDPTTLVDVTFNIDNLIRLIPLHLVFIQVVD